VNPLREFAQPATDDPRPEFMVTLGLAPPYTLDDVKQAYLEKAKTAHPDRGGTASDFALLQDAFERAQEYISFRSDRRAWIASQMERYIALEKAINRLRQLGAEVTTDSYDWMQQSFGDFAQLTESPLCVRAAGAANGDELIAAMVADHGPLHELREIELPGAKVSDDAVLTLRVFTMLRRLDLSGTDITERALEIVDDLPALEAFEVDDTQLGWWKKHRLASKLRHRAE
jgi:hypothetical protein